MAAAMGARSRFGTACVVLAALLASCDYNQDRTTARVQEVGRDGRTICIMPVDRSQTELDGCYLAQPEQVIDVAVGDCVEVVLHRAGTESDDAPGEQKGRIGSLRSFGRDCK